MKAIINNSDRNTLLTKIKHEFNSGLKIDAIFIGCEYIFDNVPSQNVYIELYSNVVDESRIFYLNPIILN